MPRLTPLVIGFLVVLLAGCATAAIDQPTAPASVAATSSSSSEPDSPSPASAQAPTAVPDGSSPSPSQAATAAPDSLPSAPTDVIAKSAGGEKPGTMITFQITWAGATATDTYRVYEYQTGEVPNPQCVFNKELGGGPLADTQPGATSVEVKLDAAVTGAGNRCLYVVAVNAAGESSPVLAWRSSD